MQKCVLTKILKITHPPLRQALTDPSYAQQLLVLTYPLVGNYGVPSAAEEQELTEKEAANDPVACPGLPRNRCFESHRVWPAALIVGRCCPDGEHSHWEAVRDFQFFKKLGKYRYFVCKLYANFNFKKVMAHR